jgi:hypothetical protein
LPLSTTEPPLATLGGFWAPARLKQSAGSPVLTETCASSRCPSLPTQLTVKATYTYLLTDLRLVANHSSQLRECQVPNVGLPRSNLKMHLIPSPSGGRTQRAPAKQKRSPAVRPGATMEPPGSQGVTGAYLDTRIRVSFEQRPGRPRYRIPQLMCGHAIK